MPVSIRRKIVLIVKDNIKGKGRHRLSLFRILSAYIELKRKIVMMKFSIYESRMCLVLGFVFSFSACKDDDDDKSDKTTNQWIESAMRSYYLWYEEIPDKKELNL